MTLFRLTAAAALTLAAMLHRRGPVIQGAAYPARSARAPVEYQLGRLTNDELVQVERKDNDVEVPAGVLRDPDPEAAYRQASATKPSRRS